MQREEHIRLFGDSRTTPVTVTVLQETYDDAVRLAEENKWRQDEANTIVFCNGLSFLRGNLLLQKVSTGSLSSDEALARLSSDVQKYMGMYSAMKYQAFMKTRDNEAMDMNLTALRRANRALAVRNDQFRPNEERLLAELRRAQEENAQLKARLAALNAPEVAGERPANVGGSLFARARSLFARGRG